MVYMKFYSLGIFKNPQLLMGLPGATRITTFRLFNDGNGMGHWLFSGAGGQANSNNYYWQTQSAYPVGPVETFGFRGYQQVGQRMLSNIPHLTTCTEMATGDGHDAMYYINDHMTPKAVQSYQGYGDYDWRDLSYQMGSIPADKSYWGKDLAVGSIFLYNRVLTQEERRLLNGYLNHRWGISWP